MNRVSVHSTCYPTGEVKEHENGMIILKPEERPAPDTKEFNKMWKGIHKATGRKNIKLK